MTFELHNIRYCWKARHAPVNEIFRDLSVQIGHGESVGVVGREGSGKTTMLTLLGGLVKPDQGDVRLNGADCLSDKAYGERVRLKIAFTFQFPDEQFLCPTIREEFRDLLHLRGVTAEESQGRMVEALHAMGMNPETLCDRSPFSLSLGESRRMALALALASHPEAALFDEPTSGLDSEGTERAVQALRALHQAGATIVVATHEVDLLRHVVRRVIVLDEGRIALDGSAADFLRDPSLLRRFGYEEDFRTTGDAREEHGNA